MPPSPNESTINVYQNQNQGVKVIEFLTYLLLQDPENVIVVHCKGGKGRTGTMICVWLIEIGIFTSAEDSLDFFGHRRTDTNVSSKFQVVL